MSWIEDHEADLYYDEQQQYEDNEYEARMGNWYTRGGKKLKIKDMETSHIKNCIAFIRRNDKRDLYEPFVVAFKAELERRGGSRR